MVLQIIRLFCRRLASNVVGNSSCETHLSVLILSFFLYFFFFFPFSISQAVLHPFLKIDASCKSTVYPSKEG